VILDVNSINLKNVSTTWIYNMDDFYSSCIFFSS